MKNNENGSDSVPFRPDTTCAWQYTVPREVLDPTERIRVTLALVEKMFTTTEEFLIPTGAEFVVYSTDEATNFEEFKENLGRATVTTGRVDSSDSISYHDLIERIEQEVPTHRTRWIPRVDIDEAAARIRLPNGDHYVDRNSPTYGSFDGDSPDSRPTDDPIELTLRDTRPEDSEYLISVWTHTDVWFRESAEGAVNRERLGRVLRELRDSLSPCAVELYSDYYGDRWLKQRGFDELVLE